MNAAADRRTELAVFLRKRREAIRPEDVGLPAGGRRRTPGLRREEVAALADVGVTWYTWLEQARDINVSAEVLDAVARALRLDQRERTHLFTLSARVDVDAEPGTCAALPPGHDLMLQQLEPYPVATLSWRYDLLAYNETYRVLCADLDEIPPEERNLLWLMFTHPDWADFNADREVGVQHMVAKFRLALGRHVGDPLALELVGRLCQASPEFAEVWGRNEVAPREVNVKVLRTRAGIIRVQGQRLLHGDDGHAWTMAYVPADEHTLRVMQRLATYADRSRPAAQPA